MLLVGILSAVAFSRFANPDIYNEALLVNKLQSYLRLAQQVALSNASSSNTLSSNTSANSASQLKIEANNNQWKISVFNDAHSRVHQLSMQSAIALDEQEIYDTLVLNFSENGDLVEVQLGAVTKAVSKSIALQIGTASICIAPTGYSYEGACI